MTGNSRKCGAFFPVLLLIFIQLRKNLCLVPLINVMLIWNLPVTKQNEFSFFCDASMFTFSDNGSR